MSGRVRPSKPKARGRKEPKIQISRDVTKQEELDFFREFLKLTDEQISQIENLKIDNFSDSDVKHEIVSLIYQLGFDIAYDFLKDVKSSDDIFFKSPLLERQNFILQKEIELYTQKILATKGRPCPKCKSTTTDVREIGMRSGDEGLSVFIFCYSCNKLFTI